MCKCLQYSTCIHVIQKVYPIAGNFFQENFSPISPPALFSEIFFSCVYVVNLYRIDESKFREICFYNYGSSWVGEIFLPLNLWL